MNHPEVVSARAIFVEIQESLQEMQRFYPSKVNLLEKDEEIFAQLETSDDKGRHHIEFKVWLENGQVLGQIFGNYLIEDELGDPKDLLEIFKRVHLMHFFEHE